ncbi:MAG TPA: hypothetical protein VL128_10260 [Candidatus Eisenbacteria bacterium]|nr:hypothetical protein [Candidatus Eisenbacteria bacterium]
MKLQTILLAGAFAVAQAAYAQRPEEDHPQAQHPEAPHAQEEHPQTPHSTEKHPEPRYAAPRANQGHIPPPPVKRPSPSAPPETERHVNGKVNGTQHVSNNQWYGHDRPDDKRYHLDHPFEHGHFEHFGASYRYRIERIDRDHHRFWLPGGFYFEVASWDWPICADWCWDCSDDFVIYEDPDHSGWYLLYNVYTGAYVHVMYMGG